MSRAVLSLGSNLGDRLATLTRAIDGLGAAVVAVSPVYETAPWGPVPQGDYLNLVAIVDDEAADAGEWLARAQALEQAAGRVRDVRFGPRTLDVDVISVVGVRSDDPVLTLPHPRAQQRAFVLIPWLDVEPTAELAGHGPAATLLAGLDDAERAGVRARPDLKDRRAEFGV
jgi:2-amino-4-hydroxy-6-hydroxymethyldihydropteridine diphosphokinase